MYRVVFLFLLDLKQVCHKLRLQLKKCFVGFFVCCIYVESLQTFCIANNFCIRFVENANNYWQHNFIVIKQNANCAAIRKASKWICIVMGLISSLASWTLRDWRVITRLAHDSRLRSTKATLAGGMGSNLQTIATASVEFRGSCSLQQDQPNCTPSVLYLTLHFP